MVHQIPRLGPLKKQVQQLGPDVDICCYRPEVFEMLTRSGFNVVPLDSGCDLEDLKRIRELSLEILRISYESTSPILDREFGGAADRHFLSSMHYNYHLSQALISFLIPYYQLSGLLSKNEYSEVVEARPEGDFRNFEQIYSGNTVDRPAISTLLACRNNSVKHAYSTLDLYRSGASKQISRIRRNIRARLGRLKRRFQPVLPDLDGNSRSIIPLSKYDFPWVHSRLWKEIGFDTRALPRRHLSSGYRPDTSRIESLSSSMKLAVLNRLKDDPAFAPEDAELIEHVLSMYFDFFAGQLDLFEHCIRDERESYDAVRLMSIPTVDLKDVAFVRSLIYKQARMISWQHGGLYGFTELPIFLHHDLLNCDVFLGYGTSTQAYVDDAQSKMNGSSYPPWGKVEVLGSYGIPAKVKRRNGGLGPKDGKLELLYACRDYQPVLNNLTNAWVMTSLLYYDIQKEILTSLAGLDWANITVQPHPGNPESAVALRDWADDRSYRNVSFGEPGGYRSALETADVVLCDFPSSTFVEALWSGLPVIVYQAPGSYEVVERHFEGHGDAVQLVTTTEELAGALDRFKEIGTAGNFEPVETPAFLIGRVPGFEGETELWRSILD